jgi:uncharacterized protein (DUF2141 family)
MKKIIGIFALLFWLTGCSSQPEIIDNGAPGQIKVLVFQDNNRNQLMDGDEQGLVERVGISQSLSCPAGDSSQITQADTGSDGVAVFRELKPGTYCVMFMGMRPMTTKMTLEIGLSSDQEAVVLFGIAD